MNGEDIIPIRRIESQPQGSGEEIAVEDKEENEELEPVSSELEVLVEPQKPARRQLSVWFSRVIKGVIMAAALLVPVAYLRITTDFLFIKVSLVEIAAIVVGAVWLLSIFAAKRISYKRSQVNMAFLVVVLALAVSNFLAQNAVGSFWGLDPTGEKTATMMSFMVIAFVLASSFGQSDTRRLAGVLMASFLGLSLLVLVSIFWTKWGNPPAWIQTNPIGTTNALAMVLSLGFLFSACLSWISGIIDETSGFKNLKRFAGVVAVLTLASLVLLNFRMGWIAIAVVVAVFIALHLSRPQEMSSGLMSIPTMGAACVVLALSLLMIFSRGTFLTSFYQPPAEISPSFSATIDIAGKVAYQGKVFGSGPASFAENYNLFRDPALNLTNFWPLRFSHGFSFFPTMAATIGLVGVAAFLWLIVASTISSFRLLRLIGFVSPVAWASFGAMLGGFIFWFLYSSNFTANFLIFLFIGMLGAVLHEPPAVEVPLPYGTSPDDGGSQVEGRRPRWMRIWDWLFRFQGRLFKRRRAGSKRSLWRISRRSIEVAAPGLNFAVSLFVVFLLAIALISVYFLVTQYSAEVAYARGLNTLNTTGNLDQAESFLARASSLNPTEDRYPNAQAQLALIRLQLIVRETAQQPTSELQDLFRNTLSAGVNSALEATRRDSGDPANWFIQGQLFEAVLPFLAGADQQAISSYGRALDADPINPVFPFAQGRVYITVSDLLTLQIYQTRSGEERSRLEALRADIYKKASESLELSLKLKPDYAQAHFLLAQLAIREDDLGSALSRTENVARLAPADIGVAFQLGVLYYRAERLDEAKREFERAVLFNDNYSNARYFLGLIWDRKGDKDAALSQFQKIAALNPDNDEVKRIMANLQAGKSALAGIVPPAPAPETRKEAPVKERGEEERALRRR